MKVLVVLALALAVAQAGFTGSLNQQVAPHLQQAMQQMRVGIAAKAPARNSAEVAFQARFLQGIQEHIENQISQIQEAMDQAQAIAEQMVSSTQTTIAALQQVGANAQQIISTWVSNMMGLFNNNNNANNARALPAIVESIVGMLVNDDSFVDQVHASPVYNCLKDGGITVDLTLIRNIMSQKPDGWNNFLADNTVKSCIDQADGLTYMIASSSMVQGIVAMVKPMGLSDMVANLVTSNVNQPEAGQILAGLGLSRSERALSPAMAAIVGSVVTNPAFVNAVHNSATYLCLKAGGYDVTYAMVQSITQSNGWNEFLAEEPVQDCIEQAGGLTNMIQSSSLVGSVQSLVKPMGLGDAVVGMINSHVGHPWNAQIIQGLGLGRGFFGNIGNAIGNVATGAWQTVSGAAVGAWNGVTSGAGQLAQFVSNIASTALDYVPSFDTIKEIATQFVMTGANEIAQLAANQAFAMMAAMYPHAAALGPLWSQAVGVYETAHGALSLLGVV